MNEEKYSIEELAKTFASHMIEADKIRFEMIEKFKENNPDKPLPDYMQKDFNLPRALQVICNEILNLKAGNGNTYKT